MNPYPYDNSGWLPSHSPGGYPDSGTYPGREYPPPQYTPNPAPPGSSHHYTSPSDVSPYAHSQSPATYNNSQAVPSPYASDTRPYPAELKHGHYTSFPGPSYPTSHHDLNAPDTGPHQAYRGPHAPDTGSYGAYSDPYPPHRAYRDPRAADTGSYESYRDARTPNTGSYQAYHDPRASVTGQYPVYGSPRAYETRPFDRCQSLPSSSPPANSALFSPSDVGLHSGASQPPEYGHKRHPRSSSSQPSPDYRPPGYSSSQAPERQRSHSSSDAGRDGGTLTAEKSAARTRGSDARADASNAIPVSDFVSEHLVRCHAPTDFAPTPLRRWFVMSFSSLRLSLHRGLLSESNCPCSNHCRHLGHGGHYWRRSSCLQGDHYPVARRT